MKSSCVICSSPNAGNNPYPLTMVEGKQIEPGDNVCGPCDRGVIQLRRYFLKNPESSTGSPYGPPVTLESSGEMWYLGEYQRIVLPLRIWEPDEPSTD